MSIYLEPANQEKKSYYVRSFGAICGLLIGNDSRWQLVIRGLPESEQTDVTELFNNKAALNKIIKAKLTLATKLALA